MGATGKCMSDNEIYRFGGFRLEAGQRRLWHGQEPVDLPPKVFDTLLLLLRRAGLLITRDEFFACLWPNTVVTEATRSTILFGRCDDWGIWIRTMIRSAR